MFAHHDTDTDTKRYNNDTMLRARYVRMIQIRILMFQILVVIHYMILIIIL